MWRKAVQLQKTALRESFLEVIRLFFCIIVLCGEICCFYWGHSRVGGLRVTSLVWRMLSKKVETPQMPLWGFFVSMETLNLYAYSIA